VVEVLPLLPPPPLLLLLNDHFLEQSRDTKRGEFIPISLIKLVLELHPVQTKSVEETLEDIHGDDNGKRNGAKHRETDEHTTGIT